LRTLLAGGDRRSIARSGEALALLRARSDLLPELVHLTRDQDWLVVMRAMDLLEKLAHEKPEWIQPWRGVFIGPLAGHESWEIRLQIARALPLLRWTARQRTRALAVLRRYLKDPQKFVRAWALDGLARFAETDASLRPMVRRTLLAFEASGSPSLGARARQIRARLGANRGGAGRPRR
jgi:HEAT repeat protein